MNVLCTVRRYAAQLRDILRVAAGLVIENAVLQLAVYPRLAVLLGTAGYGDMQYLLAFPAVLSVALGTALVLVRMTANGNARAAGGAYHATLLLFCAAFLPLGVLVARFGGVTLSPLTTTAYALLFLCMAWRTYAEVSFKLTLRFGACVGFYTAIALGYLAGLPLARALDAWPLAILVGESAGILFAYLIDDTLRRGAFCVRGAFGNVLRGTLLLFFSEGVSLLIFNADRVLLRGVLDGEAVALYYLSTLVGKTASFVALPLSGVLLGYLARYEGGISRQTVRKILLAALGAIGVLTCICTFGAHVILRLLYPLQYGAVAPLLLLGTLSGVLYFVTSVLLTVLLRFARRALQLWIGAAYASCFFAVGLLAARHAGLRGFVYAAALSGGVRFLLTASLFLFRVGGRMRGGEEMREHTAPDL